MFDNNTDVHQQEDVLLSVVLRCQNTDDGFKNALNALLNQTFPWFELIIANNGAQQAELAQLAALDARIKLLPCPGMEPDEALAAAKAACTTGRILTAPEDCALSPSFLDCYYWHQELNPEEEWSISPNGEFKLKNPSKQNSEATFHYPKRANWTQEKPKAPGHKHMLWMIPRMVMGGADKFNVDAITGIREKGIDSFVLTTESQVNSWKDRFEANAKEVLELPEFLTPMNQLTFMDYYIRSRKIDVVMVAESYTGYYMIPWLRQHFPHLVIIDYIHLTLWYWRNGSFAHSSENVSGLIDKTYVCNSVTRQEIVDQYNRDPDSTQCLYIGVDQNHFAKEQEEPGYLHSLLNLEANRPIVLFPCRIAPVKRPLMALAIAKKVREAIPDVAFVVCGDGEQLDEMQQKTAELGLENTVYYAGAMQNMRPCYRDSKLTLICSLIEGLTLTAYESLSMGVPVVSSDVVGQRDLVGSDVGALIPTDPRIHPQDASTSFSEDEIALYAEHISRILSDDQLYRELSQNGRRKIENGFTIQNMIDKLSDELYRMCADPKLAATHQATAAALGKAKNLSTEFYSAYVRWEAETKELRDWAIYLEKDNLRMISELKQMDSHIREVTAWARRLEGYITNLTDEATTLRNQNQELVTWASQLESKNQELNTWAQTLEGYNANLTNEAATLRNQNQELVTWANQLEGKTQELTTWAQTLEGYNVNLTNEASSLREENQRLVQEMARQADEIAKLQSLNADLLEGKQWLEGQNQNLTARVDELGKWSSQLEENKNWLEQISAGKDARISELEQWASTLEESKNWLTQDIAAKDARLAELEQWIAELEEAKAYLQNQWDAEIQNHAQTHATVKQLTNELADKDNTLGRHRYMLRMLLSDSWIQKIIKMKKYNIEL